MSWPWHRALGELAEGHGKQEPWTLLEGLTVLLWGGAHRDTCRSNTVPQHVWQTPKTVTGSDALS